MEKLEVATMEEWFYALVDTEGAHFLYGNNRTDDLRKCALMAHATTAQAIRIAIGTARADGAREALANIKAEVEAMYDRTPHKRTADGKLNFEYDSGLHQGMESAFEDVLNALETILPPHDATEAVAGEVANG